MTYSQNAPLFNCVLPTPLTRKHLIKLRKVFNAQPLFTLLQTHYWPLHKMPLFVYRLTSQKEIPLNFLYSQSNFPRNTKQRHNSFSSLTAKIFIITKKKPPQTRYTHKNKDEGIQFTSNQKISKKDMI